MFLAKQLENNITVISKWLLLKCFRQNINKLTKLFFSRLTQKEKHPHTCNSLILILNTYKTGQPSNSYTWFKYTLDNQRLDLFSYRLILHCLAVCVLTSELSKRNVSKKSEILRIMHWEGGLFPSSRHNCFGSSYTSWSWNMMVSCKNVCAFMTVVVICIY